jgi:hypothetical protein
LSSHPVFCPITHYEVTKVTDASGKTVSGALSTFKMGDSLDANERDYTYYQNLLIYDTSTVYENYWVHVRAYSGKNATAEAIVARVSVVEA